MRPVNVSYHLRAQSRLLNLLSILALFLLPAGWLNGQAPAVLEKEGETPVFALQPDGEWLPAPAAEPEFVLLRPVQVVRIVTLHRNLPPDAEPGSITLFYGNGGYDLGVWQAEAIQDPERPEWTYWVVYLDEEVYPGRYRIIDSDPGTWANTGQTEGQGVVWIFSRQDAM